MQERKMVKKSVQERETGKGRILRSPSLLWPCSMLRPAESQIRDSNFEA